MIKARKTTLGKDPSDRIKGLIIVEGQPHGPGDRVANHHRQHKQRGGDEQRS